ncbi:unnamed protein product, partial [Rotaria socialis]
MFDSSDRDHIGGHRYDSAATENVMCLVATKAYIVDYDTLDQANR